MMSIYPTIEIISGPAAPSEIENVIRHLLPEKSLPMGEYRHSMLDITHQDDGSTSISTDALDEVPLSRFAKLFTQLCAETDWELRLDWDDLESIDPGSRREYLYRPLGGGQPREYAPEGA
ncbi:hypothetical protein HMPREF2752_00495 [Corynebacterium sp. HMSC077C02]|nr:hypothetical protein HMPREF2752_00495 [Corynebacterium sp. HMSC077C02]